MNLALEKGERVTMGGKGRGETGGETEEVTGVVANAPTDGLGKRYGTFNGWGIAAGKLEVLLVVDGFDAEYKIYLCLFSISRLKPINFEF